ncbi:hypothetical protein [Caulobacter sp.]|uniref:hypothetical protein n=1 Tax=Caulobacter sp. TaxID=78 RepID=UPI002B49742A|nr:hypothetical protein [Caulobacter sp.]HJV42712.1 hypothetical protein [Caulobacter sp.]
MNKLKSTVSYKQFDAPRSADAQSWPVLERMAKAQNALSHFEPTPTIAPSVETVSEAAPTLASATTARVEGARVEGSLFDRLHAQGRAQGEGEAPRSARFSRYAETKIVEEAPQALSEIFDRIARKVR